MVLLLCVVAIQAMTWEAEIAGPRPELIEVTGGQRENVDKSTAAFGREKAGRDPDHILLPVVARWQVKEAWVVGE